MSAMRIPQRLATGRIAGLLYNPTRLIFSSSLGLHLRSDFQHPPAAAQSFHTTPIRCISQAKKDKVKERDEVTKKGLSVEDRVKIIVANSLGVKIDEVCKKI